MIMLGFPIINSHLWLVSEWSHDWILSSDWSAASAQCLIQLIVNQIRLLPTLRCHGSSNKSLLGNSIGTGGSLLMTGKTWKMKLRNQNTGSHSIILFYHFQQSINVKNLTQANFSFIIIKYWISFLTCLKQF